MCLKYSLRFIQNRVDFVNILQIRLQNRRRGSSRKALADSQAARVFEGIMHLPAK